MDTVRSSNPITNIRLSGNVLKLIACILMLIDHSAYGILHNYLRVHYMDMDPGLYTELQHFYDFCEGIGRLAFPIFAFFLVEGFLHTRSVVKYAIRLLVFAALSEVPFDLGLFGVTAKWDHQNVILSFFIALCMLVMIQYVESNVFGLSTSVVYMACICIVIAFAQLSQFLHVDYSWKCMLLVAVLYFTRKHENIRLVAGAAAMSWEHYAPASFLLLYFYDPDIRPKYKYAFYIFYPLHLIIIALIAKMII